MRIRLAVAVGLSVAALFAWGAAASTQEAATSSGSTAPNSAGLAELRQTLEEQAQVQQSKLLDHMERVEEAQSDHEARMAQLGNRAPVETIPPVATTAPMPTVPPPAG
jgi:hypothetical protein